MENRVPLKIVYTGNGKGKTTAAMGLVMRTLGHQKACAVLQFIKMSSLETGEKKFAQQHGILWENYGEGFLWNAKDMEPTRKACVLGWQRAIELIQMGTYELIVLDEFTYALQKGFVDTASVVSFLESLGKGDNVPHIVITGRDAPDALITVADMVHELVEIKHPWRNEGVKAQRCIEY